MLYCKAFYIQKTLIFYKFYTRKENNFIVQLYFNTNNFKILKVILFIILYENVFMTNFNFSFEYFSANIGQEDKTNQQEEQKRQKIQLKCNNKYNRMPEWQCNTSPQLNSHQ